MRHEQHVALKMQDSSYFEKLLRKRSRCEIELRAGKIFNLRRLPWNQVFTFKLNGWRGIIEIQVGRLKRKRIGVFLTDQ